MWNECENTQETEHKNVTDYLSSGRSMSLHALLSSCRQNLNPEDEVETGRIKVSALNEDKVFYVGLGEG